MNVVLWTAFWSLVTLFYTSALYVVWNAGQYVPYNARHRAQHHREQR